MFRPQDLVQLKGLLHRRRMLALVGAAGSGKSALLDDLTQALQARGMAAMAGAQWLVLRPRVGADVFEALARELARPGWLVPADHKPPADLDRTLTDLLLDPQDQGMRRVLTAFPYLRACNLLLVIDPVETLMEGTPDNTRRAFLKLLTAVGEADDLPVYVVLGLRPPLYDDLQETPLGTYLQDPYMLYPLGQVRIRQLIAAELAHIARTHRLPYRTEPALLDYLAKNLARAQDQMQRLNDELRDFRDLLPKIKGLTYLDFPTYRRYKGISEAEESHATEASQAEEWYLTLSPATQEQVKRVFQALVQPRLQGDPPANRPLPLKRLALIVGDKPEVVAQWLRPLQQPRMRLLTPGHTTPLQADTQIRLVHPPADHPWARLRGWIADEEDRAAFYLQLSQRAKAWAEENAAPLSDYQRELVQNWWQSHRPRAAWGSLYADNYRQVKDFVQSQSEADSAPSAPPS